MIIHIISFHVILFRCFENNAITNSNGEVIDTNIPSDEKLKNESFNTFSFGGNYTTNKDGLNYGIVTTDSFMFYYKRWRRNVGYQS